MCGDAQILKMDKDAIKGNKCPHIMFGCVTYTVLKHHLLQYSLHVGSPLSLFPATVVHQG